MPLLIPLVGVQTATPLVAFMALTTTLMVLWNTWRSIDLRAARQLIVASAVGIPFGLYILTDAPQTLVSGILGMLPIAYGLYSLIRPELPTLTWSGRTYAPDCLAARIIPTDHRWCYWERLCAGRRIVFAQPSKGILR